MNEKKYSRVGFGLTLFSLLLLALTGCNPTSDPQVNFPTTGSWQGTVGTEQVRGIISPDGTYHLAIVDAAGDFVPGAGEFVGGGISVDPAHIGSMTLERVQEGVIPSQTQITFKLSADRLYSNGVPPINLSRTAEAAGPALSGDIAGHWSFGDNITKVVINGDGTLSGGDGVDCHYSGTVQLMTPTWNIYRLDLTLAGYLPYGCADAKGSYQGLAMRLSGVRDRLWLGGNNRNEGGMKTFFAQWPEIVNDPPVAKMTILGERADHSILVQTGTTVDLDAQGSSDANLDLLTYLWSGSDPNGNALIITASPAPGTRATFVPGMDGNYLLRLTVSDGLTSTVLNRQVRVESTPVRYIDCQNGTILDPRRNILWLQDASCQALNLNYDLVLAEDIWGARAPQAQGRIDALLQDGLCGLVDGSPLGAWHLPTRDEFRQLITLTSFAFPPALLNGSGSGQWSEGDLFKRVGVDPLSLSKTYLYWTSEPASGNNWYNANFNYGIPEVWSSPEFAENINTLWPVRALRENEQCPPVP